DKVTARRLHENRVRRQRRQVGLRPVPQPSREDILVSPGFDDGERQVAEVACGLAESPCGRVDVDEVAAVYPVALGCVAMEAPVRLDLVLVARVDEYEPGRLVCVPRE